MRSNDPSARPDASQILTILKQSGPVTLTPEEKLVFWIPTEHTVKTYAKEYREVKFLADGVTLVESLRENKVFVAKRGKDTLLEV